MLTTLVRGSLRIHSRTAGSSIPNTHVVRILVLGGLGETTRYTVRAEGFLQSPFATEIARSKYTKDGHLNAPETKKGVSRLCGRWTAKRYGEMGDLNTELRERGHRKGRT